MTITVDDLKNNIFNFIANNIVLRVDPVENKKHIIYDHPNSPQPAPPYSVLNIITGFNQLANDTIIYNSGTDKFEIDGIREFTLNLEVRGKNALQIISDFQTRLNLPEVTEEAFALGLTINNITSAVNLTSLRETTWEDVRSMDLIMMINSNVESVIDPIENVEGDFDVSGRTGSYQVLS